MSNAFLIAKNILKIAFRKKGNIIVFLVLPIVSILISLAAYSNLGAQTINIGVINSDNSLLASDMIKSMVKEDNFKITSAVENEISDKVSTGKLDCVLIIPEGFEEGVYSKKPKEIRIVSIKGEDTTTWIKSYANFYVKNLVDIAEASNGDKNIFNKIYENYKKGSLVLKVSKLEDKTQSKGITTQSLGFLLMFMMLGAGITSGFMLKEKRNRTYYRICAAPVKAGSYILGNVLANLIIIFIQVLLVLIIATQVLKINTYVPASLLLLILICFGVVAIGIGMVIAAFSKDTIQAGTLTTLIITPTCMLGGSFWPVRIMPATMQKISNFMPQKWAIEAVEKLQAGGSLSDISLNIAVILAFAAAFFLIAVYKFNSSEGVKNFV